MKETTNKFLLGKCLTVISALLIAGSLINYAQKKATKKPTHFASTKLHHISDTVKLMNQEKGPLFYFKEHKIKVNIKEMDKVTLQKWLDKAELVRKDRKKLEFYMSSSKSGFIESPMNEQPLTLLVVDKEKTSTFRVWYLSDKKWLEVKQLIQDIRAGKQVRTPAEEIKEEEEEEIVLEEPEEIPPPPIIIPKNFKFNESLDSTKENKGQQK